MITATEAQELVKCSDLSVQRYLDMLDPAIREAATSGRTFLVSSTVPAGHDVFSLHELAHKTPVLSVLQMRIASELQRLNFRAQFEKHGDPYIPRGSSGETHYQHWTLIVRWQS